MDEGDINLMTLSWLTVFFNFFFSKFDNFGTVSSKCICNYIKNIFDIQRQEIPLISKINIILFYFHSCTQECMVNSCYLKNRGTDCCAGPVMYCIPLQSHLEIDLSFEQMKEFERMKKFRVKTNSEEFMRWL